MIVCIRDTRLYFNFMKVQGILYVDGSAPVLLYCPKPH